MTLPAHRFRDREEREKDGDDGSRTWCVDYDGTVTGAPDQMARIASALKALGDRIIVLTGNQSPRADLVKQLDAYGFPFDDLVQYHDDGTNGIERAQHLKQFGAWGAFDNRVDRAIILGKVCPHLYLIAEPTDDEKQAAKDNDSKKNAKQAAKAIKRSEARGAASPPPNLRESTSSETDQPEHECGTCRMYDPERGACWGYGLLPVDGEWVCDSWALDPNWRQQDAAQDAADDIQQ